MGTSQSSATSPAEPTTRLIASESSWIESDAVRQLESVATRPGIKLAVGYPDLHPGKDQPIGTTFVSRSHIHPTPAGNDIGRHEPLADRPPRAQAQARPLGEKSLESLTFTFARCGNRQTDNIQRICMLRN